MNIHLYQIPLHLFGEEFVELATGDATGTLEDLQQIRIVNVHRKQRWIITLLGNVSEPLQYSTTAVILRYGYDADVHEPRVINVAIDVIRHKPVGYTTQPRHCHQLMDSIGATKVVNVGIVLSLRRAGAVALTIGVLLPEVDAQLSQSLSAESIHVHSLRHVESEAYDRLAQACAVLENELSLVPRIQLVP